jgi:hypothetical protein
MFDNAAATLIAAGVGIAACGGTYALTNGRAITARVRSWFAAAPAPDASDNGDVDLATVLDVILAVRILTLELSPQVRTAALGECDKFESTVRGLFAGEGGAAAEDAA